MRHYCFFRLSMAAFCLSAVFGFPLRERSVHISDNRTISPSSTLSNWTVPPPGDHSLATKSTKVRNCWLGFGKNTFNEDVKECRTPKDRACLVNLEFADRARATIVSGACSDRQLTPADDDLFCFPGTKELHIVCYCNSRDMCNTPDAILLAKAKTQFDRLFSTTSTSTTTITTPTTTTLTMTTTTTTTSTSLTTTTTITPSTRSAKVVTKPPIERATNTSSTPPPSGFSMSWSGLATGVAILLFVAGLGASIYYAWNKRMAANLRRSLIPYIEYIVANKRRLLGFYREMEAVSHDMAACTGFNQNTDQNRFDAIVCVEQSRVQADSLNYIHANQYGKWIMTQAPLCRTAFTFFSMLVVTNTPCLVQLCLPTELGPSSYLLVEKVEDEHEHEDREEHTTNNKEEMSKLLEQETREAALYRTTAGKRSLRFIDPAHPEDHCIVTYSKLTHRCGFIVRSLKIELRREGQPVRTHSIDHFLVTSWPDRGICFDTESLAGLILQMQDYDKVAVHCFAGIGRTATFVLSAECTRVALAGDQLDLRKIGVELRMARARAIQNKRQYVYSVYLCLLALRQKCIPLPQKLDEEIASFARKIMVMRD